MDTSMSSAASIWATTPDRRLIQLPNQTTAVNQQKDRNQQGERTAMPETILYEKTGVDNTWPSSR